MNLIIWSVVAALTLRYLPGFKCPSYCKYRQYRYKRAQIKLMSLYQNKGFTHLSKKEMIILYKQTTHFGCTALDKLQNEDIAREILKHLIVEKELLC